MSASPCFQCFKAVFFLHFYPPHVSKVSRKERKCCFLSAICSVNSLFCSTTTLPSAFTEAPFTNQTDSTLRFSVDTTLPATVNCFRPFTCLNYFAYRRIISVRKYDAVGTTCLSSSQCLHRLRPHVGLFGNSTG